MKIVLLQDIKNIGKSGDVKEVSDGYARNFLLPKKLAELATTEAIKKVEIMKAKQAQIQQADLEKTQALAESLQGCEVIIQAKNKEGKLFGSINAKTIAKELKKENLEVSEKCIALQEAIREVGDYEVKIELNHGIEATVRVIIEDSN